MILHKGVYAARLSAAKQRALNGRLRVRAADIYRARIERDISQGDEHVQAKSTEDRDMD
jgi:hypothetical protein